MNERNEMTNEMTEELSDLEARLSRLSPSGVSDRNVLMFRAGRAAGARSRRRWQVVSLAAVCVAVVGAMFGTVRPEPRVVERVVYVQPRQTAPTPRDLPVAATYHRPDESLWARAELSELSYIRLRREVLEHGLGALPVGNGYAGEPQSVRQLMDELHEAGSNG